MTTSYTDSLRLALQGFNDNANTWGTVLNNQLTLLDKAGAGIAVLDVTGSVTIDLTTSATDGSDSLSKRAVLKFTGLPTADCSVKTPAVSKIYYVHSSLTANKNIFIHPTGSSVGVTVGPSDTMVIYCDGTDMIKLLDNFDSDLALLKSGNLSSIANTSAALVNLGITTSVGVLNSLTGLTASVSELNVLDGITASVTELNKLDGVLVTTTKINYLNDVTSSIQGQITNLTSVINVVSAAAPAVTNTSAGKIVIGAITIQWGNTGAATTGTDGSVTFGTAFSTTPHTISLSEDASPQGGTGNMTFYSLTASGFQWRKSSNSSSIYWTAIGPT